ncbi:response regulator receiver protein [Thermincola ferriacetica]|uniref:Stage 0 sporulation protein A homolog n=1 Tax=Thermincola ferriacetica TaxID=281456 RepID=A0A0L6W2T1_9FIRM|nr:response regulator [Thermincola ferriacetica]KNZ69882.1 response regulator receiver protein [Thermincola ferriacetica]
MSGFPLKVLIVDDQAGVRHLLEAVAQEEGCQTFTGCNGFEAVDQVKKNQPDLIFMDIRMPGMDGTQALEIILQMGLDIEIVMMTAFAEKEVLDKTPSGRVRYLIKPFDIEEIRSIIRTLADNGNNRQISVG